MFDPAAPTETPMSPGTAEGFFRWLISSRSLKLAFTVHARKRLAARGITSEGVFKLFAEGRVLGKPRHFDGLGRSKYTLQGSPREGDPRLMRIVILAAPRNPMVRVVTVMWVDEPAEG